MPHVSFSSIDASDIETRWQTLARKSPQHSVYSTLAYARAVSEAFSCPCEAALASSRDGEDTAGVFLFSRKRGPFRLVLVPPFTAYTSILSTAPGDLSSEIAQLTETLIERYDDLRLHLYPSLKDARPFQWMDWRTTPLYTYRVDLTSLTGDFATWSAGARRNFRKHAGAFTFREDPEAAGTVIALCEASYRRQRKPFPIQIDRLEFLVQRLQEQDMARVYTVSPSDGNAATGGLVLLLGEKEAYYWIAGSLPGPSMTVLIGRLLMQLKNENYERFDFVGANTPSIAEFKRRFGAILTPYLSITRCPNRMLSVVKSVRQAFQ